LKSGRRPVVKINDEKHIVPTPLRGIRVGRRKILKYLFLILQNATTEVKKEKDSEEPKEGEEVKQEDNLDTETTILDYKEGDDLSNITRDMYPAYR
jgi:hypothetical protein